MREDISTLQVPAIKALSTSQKISQDYYQASKLGLGLFSRLVLLANEAGTGKRFL